jgi:hypothetical protein
MKSARGNFTRAQRRQVSGFHLAIYHAVSLTLKETREVCGGDLGGIGGQREHRFSVEHAPDSHSVETSHQLPIDPRLDRVRETELRQLAVGVLHFAREIQLPS